MKFICDIHKVPLPLLGAFSCRPSVCPQPSAARMPLLTLWLSPTGYGCRERHNSLFVLEYTSSRVWFLYSNCYTVKKRQLRDRRFHRNAFSQAAWDTSILYEANQGCGVISCTLVTGGRADPKYSYSYDIICMYVRIVTFDFSLKYVVNPF